MKADEATIRAQERVAQLQAAEPDILYAHQLDPITGAHEIVRRNPATFEDQIVERRGDAG